MFSPEDLKPLLGYFAIIKSSGADFRYRLYGSYITARYGEERTGQFISEKDARSWLDSSTRPITLPSQRNVEAYILVIANLVFAPDRVHYGPLLEGE